MSKAIAALAEFEAAYSQAEARRDQIRQQLDEAASLERWIGYAVTFLGELNGPTVAALTFDRQGHDVLELLDDCLRAAAVIIEASASLDAGAEGDLRDRAASCYIEWRTTDHERWRNAGYAMIALGHALTRSHDNADAKVGDLAHALAHSLITAVDVATKSGLRLAAP